MSNKQYDKQDCINSLRQAYDELGESPSAIQYRSLDIYPTYSTFYDIFGSWNEAKKAANLDVYNGRKMYDQPDMVDFSKEEWEDMSPSKRLSIRDKCKLAKVKLESGCMNCGYDEHPSALEFHHRNPKEKKFTVSKKLSKSMSDSETIAEIEKCVVLCSNCHREIENTWFNVE